MSADRIVEESLVVTVAALRKARAMLEANAARVDVGPETWAVDARALRDLYSLLIEATGPAAGALAVVRMRDELEDLAEVPTERPSHLRLSR